MHFYCRDLPEFRQGLWILVSEIRLSNFQINFNLKFQIPNCHFDRLPSVPEASLYQFGAMIPMEIMSWVFRPSIELRAPAFFKRYQCRKSLFYSSLQPACSLKPSTWMDGGEVTYGVSATRCRPGGRSVRRC